MISRSSFNNCFEIGTYSLLTNSYVILPYDTPLKYIEKFEDDLPIVLTDIAGLDIIGALVIGNKNGILLPQIATNSEISKITHELPDIVVKQIDEPNSALGNVIACNDKIAFVSNDLSNESIMAIEDTLMVEAIPITIAGTNLVGSYCVLTNRAGIVSKNTTFEEINFLEKYTGFPLTTATVNNNQNRLRSGICVNDHRLIVGSQTTSNEIASLSSIFKIDSNNDNDSSIISDNLFDPIINLLDVALRV